MTHQIRVIDLHFKGKPNGIAAFLIESGEGPILVETGPHSTLEHLENGLRNYGYKRADIQHVFISHIHLDHAGAAWCFAKTGAKIYLHPFGYRHMHDPSKLLASARMIYGDEMETLWGDLQPIPENQLIQVGDQETIRIGTLYFTAWHTPGHAKHHIAWQLGTDLFTGDVAGVCIHSGPVIPPCPPPDIDIEVWLDSIDRLSQMPDIRRYFLTHFGPVTDLTAHREKLKAGLAAYAEFMHPHYKEGKTPEEVLPEFREFVRSYLMRQGMDERDAQAYEDANPSDMSAWGLMRYWKKKTESETTS